MRINLFGGPSTGKSKLAAHLYDRLGLAGHTIEQVGEAIKPRAYRGDMPTGWQNVDIWHEQLRREREWVESGVPHLVTDSPLFLQCYYMAARNLPHAPGCLELTRLWDRENPALNLFLKRSPRITYQQAGRYQNKREAERLDDSMLQFLQLETTDLIIVDAFDRETIAAIVANRLGDPVDAALPLNAKAAA